MCGFFAIPIAARACAEPNREATVTKPEQPEYPQSAKSLGLGPVSVQIAITVDASGNVVDAHVDKSSGNAAIDEAALRAASGSKYSPKLVNCQEVAGKYLFRSDFEPDSFASVPADLPRGSQWENPFCNGSAMVVPWDEARNAPAAGPSSKTVAVFLWANAASDYAARVTLIGNGAAYSVDIPRTPVPSSSGRQGPAVCLSRLPSVAYLYRSLLRRRHRRRRRVRQRLSVLRERSDAANGVRPNPHCRACEFHTRRRKALTNPAGAAVRCDL